MILQYRYDAQYSETVLLRDKCVVTFRLLRPEDRRHLNPALKQLSNDSNYQRFFTIKSRLTEPELNYLTNIDQVNHFAMVATVSGFDNDETGIAISRFIRLKEDNEAAEFSLVVADKFQFRGLGYKLTQRLIEAALERGIKCFHGEMLASNRTMLHLLSKLGHIRDKTSNGNRIHFILPLESTGDK